MSFRMGSVNGWRGSRWRSYTDCERAGPTGTAGSPINLPDLRRWRSENGANPIRKGGRDICAWTPCIKVTCMGADLGSLAEPVLEAMLAQFPFHIRAFIPTTPASSSTTPWPRCSFKLLVEQTKSRLRHDNGLAESKNGWVIRKHIGYGHIASTHAEAFDEFYRLHFNPYLNFHRPCGVPEVTVTAKGKQKHVYRWYATPWENGRVENEENQTQVSLRFAQPLEIAARFPHSHRPCNFCVSKHSKPNSRTETLAADRFAPAFRPILQ